MDKILNLDSVDQYNSLYGLETLNPLVSVIDLNKATRQMDYVHWNYGVYALYLKLEKACDIKYGRRSYDYQEGTEYGGTQACSSKPASDVTEKFHVSASFCC